ncbi:MAG: alpha/beta hydrolase [Clostridia bacterium]|nr:alpha/beta hydrolase [Clostridia bacterium]
MNFETLKREFEGHEITLLRPENAGKNWVWRAEFLGAFDYADRALMEEGWNVLYYRISDLFGSPESIEMMKKFHDFAVKEYDLSPKADIFGFSRGGLYAANYTIKYPEDISVLYLDAPVLDLKSWPFGLGKGCGSEHDTELCKTVYGFAEGDIDSFSENPIDKAEELIKSRVPVIIVCGDSDSVVPHTENCERLIKAYTDAGAPIKYIVKKGCEHHPHSLEDPAEIVDFIKKHK